MPYRPLKMINNSCEICAFFWNLKFFEFCEENQGKVSQQVFTVHEITYYSVCTSLLIRNTITFSWMKTLFSTVLTMYMPDLNGKNGRQSRFTGETPSFSATVSLLRDSCQVCIFHIRCFSWYCFLSSLLTYKNLSVPPTAQHQ